ncbi:hypothetical protein [Streptomyces sp. NPDC004284]|uniref:hypothetical protein n=1 Tax=Streptomyces sp. NPDC004284 TaxID=3364695 RepID=UPI0036936F15
MRLRPLAAAVTLVAALAPLTGCGASGGAGPADARPTTARPSAPLPAPRTAPAPAPLLSAAPKQGEVRVAEGPFTDRVRFTRLVLDGRRALTGHLVITSDVSDVITMELRAAFYDGGGRLLGSESFTYGEDHEEEGRPAAPRAEGTGIDFSIPAKALRGKPAAAVLSVPVLVNE